MLTEGDALMGKKKGKGKVPPALKANKFKKGDPATIAKARSGGRKSPSNGRK